MRIALATCKTVPAWEKDDLPLHDALRARGVHLDLVPWDAAGVDWARYDAVLIRTTWDYMERLEDYLAWARHVGAVSRLFNPPEVVAWNTRKTYLRELEAAGVPTVPTLWLDRGAAVEVGPALAERRWTRGFLKPQVGATARETLRFDTTPAGLAAAEAHLRRTLAAEAMMLQPYLPAVEHDGELSLLYVDGRLSHAIRKRPVAGDYRVQDDFGAWDGPETPSEAALAVGRAAMEVALARFGALLYARVDLLPGPDGALYVGELEAVEPSLFLRHAPAAAGLLSDALLGRLHS